MIQAEQLHARILEELDMTREIEDEELTELIYRVLFRARRNWARNYSMHSASWTCFKSFWKMKELQRS